MIIIVPIDLNQIYTTLRAKDGDSIAQKTLNSKKVQDYDLQLESLSMSLQMQVSRVQRTALQQMQSREIGYEIRNIVNTGLDKLIKIYLTEESFYKSELTKLSERILQNMSPNGKNVYNRVKALNLVHDFSSIAYQLQNLPYQDIIRILKSLLITAVLRRSKRRRFLPGF